MKQIARLLRRNQTDAERILWRALRGRALGGYKFRRQYSIGRFVVDFACVEASLIVEVDGGQHMDQKPNDDRREEFLESRGFRVMRFWNNEVVKEAGPVLAAILSALQVPSSPTLLPEGEGSSAFVVHRVLSTGDSGGCRDQPGVHPLPRAGEGRGEGEQV